MSRFKKSFGQHFLHEKNVIKKIIDAIRPKDFDLIVEVGPGGGALTKMLAPMKSKGQLILIEADRDLIPGLKDDYPKAQIVEADAVKVSFDELTASLSWVLVSNLPYNAATAILMNALRSENPPKKLIVMVQKEQANRMLAKPGEMGLLSVATQFYTTAKRLFNVKPGAFTPPPNVDSTVLELTLRPDISKDTEAIIELAKYGFQNRRKQLHKNLSEAGNISSEKVKEALVQINLKETARAQELSIEQWKKLFEVLHKTG